MTINLIALFVGILLINQIALIRIHAQAQQMSNTFAPMHCALLTMIILICSMLLYYSIDHYLLTAYNLQVLHHFTYILVVAFAAHLICLIISTLKPNTVILIQSLFPIIMINSLGLGIIVLKLSASSFLLTLLYSTISAFIFALLLITFHFFNQKISNVNIPISIKGLPIIFITAGMLVMMLAGLLIFK